MIWARRSLRLTSFFILSLIMGQKSVLKVDSGRNSKLVLKPAHRIIVSTENNAYSGWQCKLFYFSAVTRLKHQPTFIVHDSGMDWQRDFHDLVRAGATVLAAPSYAQ